MDRQRKNRIHRQAARREKAAQILRFVFRSVQPRRSSRHFPGLTRIDPAQANRRRSGGRIRRDRTGTGARTSNYNQFIMELNSILESILFSAQHPLTPKDLRELMASAAEKSDEPAPKEFRKVSVDHITEALE